MENESPDRKLRAGIYARIRSEDALDLVKQGQVLASFAEQKGWHVARIHHETASDHVVRLSALDQLLQAVRRSEIDVVVAWKLDRVALNLPALFTFVETLRSHDAGLITFVDDFDFNAGEGSKLTRLVRALACFQRVSHQEQVRSGLAQTSKRLGRPPTTTVHLENVRVLAAQGLNLREIARRIGIHPRTVSRLLVKNQQGQDQVKQEKP